MPLSSKLIRNIPPLIHPPGEADEEHEISEQHQASVQVAELWWLVAEEDVRLILHERAHIVANKVIGNGAEEIPHGTFVEQTDEAEYLR